METTDRYVHRRTSTNDQKIRLNWRVHSGYKPLPTKATEGLGGWSMERKSYICHDDDDDSHKSQTEATLTAAKQ